MTATFSITVPFTDGAKCSIFDIARVGDIGVDVTDSVAEVIDPMICDGDEPLEVAYVRSLGDEGHSSYRVLRGRFWIDSVDYAFAIEVNTETTNMTIATTYTGEKPLQLTLEVFTANANRRAAIG